VTVQETLGITPIGVPIDATAGRSTDSGAVAEQLRHLPGVSHIAGNGTLRIYCDDGFDMLCKAVTLLEEGGIRASVSMVEPSLEDAFSIFVNNSGEAENAN
jgi:hypothetical protein